MKIQDFVGKLNSYEEKFRDKQTLWQESECQDPPVHNIWQDVIWGTEIDGDDIDEDACCDGDSFTIHFKSGLKVVLNHDSKEWQVLQSTCDHDWEWITDDNGAPYPYEVISYSYYECRVCGLTRLPGPHDCYDPEDI